MPEVMTRPYGQVFRVARRGEMLRQKALSVLTRAWPLVPLLGLFIVTDFRGINFGDHWDEVAWQLDPVREMVQSGLFMPRAAIYPALSKWLVLLPALWSGFVTALHVGLRPDAIHAAMIHSISRPEYLLEARGLFIVVSALAIVWTYCVALVLRLRTWEATVAAATLGLSWEFAYHARWVATDCIAVQFCALTLLLLVSYWRFGRRSLLYAAAVTTGLAIGTKFPAVPLLVPVVAVGASRLSPYRIRAQVVRALALLVTASVVYLITTPATLLEPFEFVRLLTYISSRYQKGHYGYTVGLGWDHLYRVMLYFGLSYFSPYPAVSFALFGGVFAGAAVWLRHNRKVGLLLVGFPIIFLLFFAFRYAALIVRNYLLLAPFFALMLARACGALVDWLPQRALRAVVYVALGGVALANGAFLVTAAESIRHASVPDDVRQAIQYVGKRPDARFRLSPRVRAVAAEQHLTLPDNVGGRRPDHVVFVAPDEGPNPFDWPSNDPFSAERSFGPLDMNFDWYPTWIGSQRVVVMTLDNARKIGAPFVGR